MCQNFFVGRRLSGFSLYFAFELAEHDKLVGVGLLAASINLQVAQHERAFAVSLQKNKWIRRPELRRVKHVGIGLAGRNDETRWSCLWFTHCGLYFSSATSLEQLFINTLL